jgi:hypothetical protein
VGIDRGGIRTHKYPDSTPTLSGELKSSSLDQGKFGQGRYCCTDTPVLHAFCQGQKFILPGATPKQYQMLQIDSRRHQSRKIQLAVRIAPNNSTASRLSGFGQQKCHGFWTRAAFPKEFMYNAALEAASWSNVIQQTEPRAIMQTLNTRRAFSVQHAA